MSHGKSASLSAGLVVGALGVVFGDVGTSPLYALRTVFADSQLDPANLGNILGVLSLIFWSILLIVAIKYVLIVLKADNDGEGGVLALTQLTIHSADPRLVAALSLIGLLIFAGLTAWDTQRLKEEYDLVAGTELAGKASVMGALSLYLNFVNMFQFILALTGQREE